MGAHNGGSGGSAIKSLLLNAVAMDSNGNVDISIKTGSQAFSFVDNLFAGVALGVCIQADKAGVWSGSHFLLLSSMSQYLAKLASPVLYIDFIGETHAVIIGETNVELRKVDGTFLDSTPTEDVVQSCAIDGNKLTVTQWNSVSTSWTIVANRLVLDIN